MKLSYRKKNEYEDEGGLEPDLTPQERLHLAESLYQEVVKIQNKPWRPFVKSFSSFKEFEAWKARQEDPRLW